MRLLVVVTRCCDFDIGVGRVRVVGHGGGGGSARRLFPLLGFCS